MRTAKEIAKLAQAACVWEVCSPKPGNVNRNHDFSDTSLEDFIFSAIAVGPAFENAAQSGVGKTIWQAVSDTRRFVRSNTNLGVILLLAPLIKACVEAPRFEDVRSKTRAILSALSIEDARLAYEAIRLANPGGLGKVSKADVAEEPSITLLEAMKIAKNRDSIAGEYATDFSITFETGLPALSKAVSGGTGFSSAVVQTFLTILSRIPDTLIARKMDLETARQVSNGAEKVLCLGGIFSPEGKAELEAMDVMLRDPDHLLNPGTTADLTTAAVFLYLVQSNATEKDH